LLGQQAKDICSVSTAVLKKKTLQCDVVSGVQTKFPNIAQYVNNYFSGRIIS